MLECALTEGAWDRTERMKKRLRRGPATAPPCCVCVREPNNIRKPKPKDNQHNNRNISPLPRSKRSPWLLGMLVPDQNSTLVYFCLSNGTTQLFVRCWLWAGQGTKSGPNDVTETQEQTLKQGMNQK